ncbi:MAG: hypothetical protein ACYDAQ_00015 [Mycobacteriales bacterium]
MDMGNGLISDLAEEISKTEVDAYAKATLERTEDGWRTRYLEVIVGGRLPGWQLVTWEYPTVMFTAGKIASTTVADILTGVSELTLGGIRATVPVLQPQMQWYKRPSMFRLDARRLPWPTLDWTLYAPMLTSGIDTAWQPQGMLISRSAPPFTLFQVAHRAFYTGDFSSLGAPQAPHEFGRVLVVRDAAWLHRVRVAPTHIDVVVRGAAATGTRVDVVGAGGRVGKPVGSTGRVRLRMSDGIAGDAWLYLTDGDRCLDYRVLGDRLMINDDLARQGVQFEIPDDPESQITSLVGQVESPREGGIRRHEDRRCVRHGRRRRHRLRGRSGRDHRCRPHARQRDRAA